jgi:hypothetical protein
MAPYKLEYLYRILNTRALDPHIQLKLKELQLSAAEVSCPINKKITVRSAH